eukprot:TRINITY_DN3553_c0_g1_i7.p1 TRINITY_DN3553_c0_g1~~TRINITY_DN3553_c0_g1_i7.p1  ORF type:complete len:284 (-),score=66.28 TRINITY_DN3553_c0_g1_i7:44-895(-)
MKHNAIARVASSLSFSLPPLTPTLTTLCSKHTLSRGLNFTQRGYDYTCSYKRLFSTNASTKATTTTTANEGSFLPSKRASNLLSISASDILPINEYIKIREQQILPLRRTIKSTHQVNVGPNATFTFLNYDMLWMQIHEMLFIEKGGEEQIPGELEAYNPLIPQGNDFVGTLMFEVGDPVKRLAFLKKLGHVEEKVYLSFSNHRILAISANNDIERTTPDGKTSAVHFLRFPLDELQVKEFSVLKETQPVLLGIEHKEYPHITKLSHDLVKSLQSSLTTVKTK